MDIDFPISENSYLSSTSSQDLNGSGIDVHTSQLHALAHPRASTPLCISALCLATYDNIFDVMASTLHQRRAWGLAEVPVLGFAFHPQGTRLQTFWGWFDRCDEDADYCLVRTVLPTARLMTVISSIV